MKCERKYSWPGSRILPGDRVGGGGGGRALNSTMPECVCQKHGSLFIFVFVSFNGIIQIFLMSKKVILIEGS